MIFTDYWKLLVFNFSKVGNTVFFLTQNFDGKMILTDYWKVLVLTFWRWEIRSFLSQNLMEDDTYWLLKSSCFELFGDGIFTCSFWVFHDIPGLAKYGFSCSGIKMLMIRLTSEVKTKRILQQCIGYKSRLW